MNRRRIRLAMAALACLCFGAVACDECDPNDHLDGGTGGDGGSSTFDGLLISEVMFDPATAEAGSEWFEIYNNTDKPINLKGLTMAVGTRDDTFGKDLVIQADSYLTVCIGKQQDGGADRKCGKWWYYGASLLTNDGFTIELKHKSSTVHTLTYAKSGSDWAHLSGSVEGKSIQISVSLLGPQGNLPRTTAAEASKGSNWCLSSATTDKYDGTNIGTPGAKNRACPNVGKDMGPDGPPPACNLKAGDILISEVMFNLKGSDSDKEWFELYNNSGAPIASLGGIEVQTWSNSGSKPTSPDSLTLPAGRKLPAGGFVTVGGPWVKAADGGAAKAADGGAKGPDAGAPFAADIPWKTMPSLTNTSGNTIVVKCLGKNGQVLHQLTYTGSSPWPGDDDGTTIQLSQGSIDGTPKLTATQAAQPNLWCLASSKKVYDGTNYGSPGSKNEVCAIKPPAGQCRDEVLGKSRPIKAPAKGNLTVIEVFMNPKSTNDYKQWVELAVSADVDLNGLKLVHDNGTSQKSTQYAPSDCKPVKAGQFVVFGSSREKTDKTASDYNGGAPVTHVLSDKTFLWATGTTTLTLQTAAGVEVDKATLPKASEAVSLCKDGSAKWGDSTTTGQFDGTGTPGSPACKHAP